MKSIEKIQLGTLSGAAVIRFQDCDPYAHLNNGRYLDYFMNAREDQVWKEYDFNIYDYSRETGFGWVVTQNQIAYVRPALLMETVTIESQLTVAKPKFIQVEMRMYDAEKKLKALLWAQFIHVDIRKGISIPHSNELQAVFDYVCLPLVEKEFNERLKVLNGG